MDALLRYILYRVAFTLLSVEILIMITCCLAIVVIKLISKVILTRRTKIQGAISHLIEASLLNEKKFETIHLPENVRQFRNLVEVLERFDHQFNDSKWVEIKDYVIKTYLVNRVPHYASSLSWFNRQLAARCCLLSPKNADDKILAELLNDTRFLVRVAAAVCITLGSNRDLFCEVIRKMSQETDLSQFPYRDALIQANEEKFSWIESMLTTETDPKVVAICIDILSTRYSPHLLSLVKPFVNAENHMYRVLSIKALGNIPNDESIEMLMDHLEDSDWEIRADAILGLQKLYATKAVHKISRLLNDPVWWVRLQAALTLKSFGKHGIEILSTQDKEKEPLAFEISQYTLALP